MKTVLITGSRYWTDWKTLGNRLNLEPEDTHFIDGGCKTGADDMARSYCARAGRMNSTMWAPWDYYGNSAGPIRNGWLLKIHRPDLVIAFPLPGSKGTIDCINQAKAMCIPVDIVEAS